MKVILKFKALVLGGVNISLLKHFIHIGCICSDGYYHHALKSGCLLWLQSAALLSRSCGLCALDKWHARDSALSQQPATENPVTAAQAQPYFGIVLNSLYILGVHLFSWKEYLNVFKHLFEIVLASNQFRCTKVILYHYRPLPK